MPVRSFLSVLILTLAFCSVAGGGERVMTLHYPPDRTVMEFGLLNVALSVTEEFKGKIVVYVNGLEEKEVLNERVMKCFSVHIDPGINEISIAAKDGKREVERHTFSVFRRSDFVRELRKPPKEFKKVFFHMSTWNQCAGCHTMEPTEADKKPLHITGFSGDMPGEPASTCYSCHKAIISYSYVHGPISVWACLSCHEPDATPCYAVKKPETQTCFKCHVEQQKNWISKKFIHGPVNIGQCSICHNPHASDHPFFLIKHSWDLCVQCHVDSGSGLHVIADVYSKKGHPTRDKPDPVRIGKELNCASCHNPHASDFPNLWAFGVESVFELCKKCHKNR
jgi:predicted CXXCH cytochrome family protein